MATLKELFGQRVRELRKAKNLTQTELAAKIDMDYRYLGGIERAEINTTLEVVERIIAGLGVEPYQFFLFSSGGEVQEDHIIIEEKIQERLKQSDPETKKALLQVMQTILELQE